MDGGGVVLLEFILLPLLLREPPSHVLYQIVLASLLHAPDGGYYELGVGARVAQAQEPPAFFR